MKRGCRMLEGLSLLSALSLTRPLASSQLPPLVATLAAPTPQQSSSLGYATAAGDVDADGFDEVVVGAPLASVSGVVRAGRAFVFRGPGLVDVLSLTSPILQSESQFGISVATGDVNGDGFADVVAGQRGASVGGLTAVGRVHVFLGPSLATSFDFTEPTPAAYSSLGLTVATGDVDGDGFGDVVTGGWLESGGITGAIYNSGKAYVFFGPAGASVFPLTPPAPEVGWRFGGSAAMGDVDGDGFDDVIVGASRADAGGPVGFDAGGAFVFLGPGLASVVPLAEPLPESGAGFGWSVATGDANGDGLADVLVGAPNATVGTLGDAGRAHLFLGPGLTTVLPVTDPTPESDASFGYSVRTGDVNGDGLADLLAGAYRANAGGLADSGEALVFLSPALAPAPPLTEPVPEAFAGFGVSVSAGDVNGDGIDDFLVGASSADVSGLASAGEAFVFVPQVDLGLDSLSLSASSGGPVSFSLDAGAANAGRPFLLVGSASGSSPCTPFGSVCVPIVVDPVTLLLLEPSVVLAFAGTLDGLGRATRTFTVGAGVFPPSTVGMGLSWAYPLFLPVDYASRPVVFEIAP